MVRDAGIINYSDARDFRKENNVKTAGRDRPLYEIVTFQMHGLEDADSK